MKTLLFTILFTNIVFFAVAQNGIYNCLTHVYRKADNTERKFYSQKLLITIDINEPLGGSMCFYYPSDTSSIRWVILSKGETVIDNNKREITKTYEAQLTSFNIPIGSEVLIAIIENMDNKKVTCWIYNDKYKSYNEYFDLYKVK